MSYHRPETRLADEHDTRKHPTESVVGPEERVHHVRPVVTYIADAGVRQLAVPLVLDAFDLAVLDEDVDLAVDGCLLANALDLVECAEVQLNGIAAGGDGM